MKFRTVTSPVCLTACLTAFGLMLVGAPAALADASITSTGPLTQIGAGRDLSCSVNYTGDSFGEFFHDTACGTFLAVGGPVSGGGTVYGASDLPAASEVYSTPFVEDGQTQVLGNGSAANPYKVSTQVDAGDSGLSLTETDSYVSGADKYTATALITNSSPAAQTVTLYHAADCYVGNSDWGYGYLDSATGGVFCAKNAANSPPGRLEGLVPVQGGSSYLETHYYENWQAVGSGAPLPDTCDCSTYQDNGIAISWTVTVPAGGGVTRSWATDFSPIGQIRVSSYVALGDSVAAGEGIAYNWTWNGHKWVRPNDTPTWDTQSGQSNAGCHQDFDAYPHALRDSLGASLLDLACTGATTAEGVIGSEPGLSGPQLGASEVGTQNTAYDNAAPDVVTLTVGADDLDFKDKVIACYTPNTNCGSDSDKAEVRRELAILATSLRVVLAQIQTRGQADGKIPIVALTQYYSPFPNSYDSRCVDIKPYWYATLSNDGMQYLEWGLGQLNDTIATAARSFPNVVLVPPPASFADHRWCSSDPWVYGASIDGPDLLHPKGRGNPAPFHPTPGGQAAIATNIAQYLADQRHVETGLNILADFGSVQVSFPSVTAAGTAYFTPMSGGSLFAAADMPARAAVANAAGAGRARARAAAALGAGSGLPPARTFAPVAVYSAGTSAAYTGPVSISMPSLGASALYELVAGTWQQVPATVSDGTLTATLPALGMLALGNPAPAVTAAFTLTGNRRLAPAAVSFNASRSTVASGAIVSYKWDFGDGASGTGARVRHTYAASGSYTVTLTAVSDAGAADRAQKTVTALNSPPVAVVRAPRTARAGQTVTGFDARRSHDRNGRVTQVIWNFGDGTPLSGGALAAHKFTRPGRYTVTTTVLDNEGARATVRRVVAVSPLVALTGPIRARAGRMTVSASCPTRLPCKGVLNIVLPSGRPSLLLASGRFELKPGQRAALSLRVRPAARALLRTAKSVIAVSSTTNGATVTLTVRVQARAKPTK